MNPTQNFHTLHLHRRTLLRGLALAAGGGALMGGLAAFPVAAAENKLSQQVAAYQATPKGKLRCDICVQWQPAASCKVVEGPISAAGWCNLYAAKS